MFHNRSQLGGIGTKKVPAAGGGDYTTGLIAHWPMNDANVSGTIITDIVGANNATSVGGVSSAGGPNATWATARAIDGVSDSYIVIATTPRDWNIGSFSIAGFVSVADNSINMAGNRVTFFSDDRVGDAITNFIRICNNNATPGALAVGVTGDNSIASTATVIASNAATFTHFVYTKSGTGGTGAKVLYINGSVVSTTSTTAQGASIIECLMGAISHTTGIIAGRLSSFRIWNRVLTSADVTALYSAGG
jgi:hypothetical protein